MIAVAIVGILSLLATIGYRKISASGKTAEAINMLGAIMVAQEAMKLETGGYLNVSDGNLAVMNRTTNCYPPGSPRSDIKISWGGWTGDMTTVNGRWNALGVNATGPVNYCYTSVAGAAGVSPAGLAATSFSTVTWPAASDPLVTRGPWVIAAATLDYDGDGTFQSLVISSFAGGIMYDREGE